MRLLYSFGILLLEQTLKIVGYFNYKIKLGVKGRASSFIELRSKLDPKRSKLWFHCASLGEYEQGLPVFKALKLKYPDSQIVLTFFSPSGYEVKKDNSIADLVIYLPIDTKRNAEQFVRLVTPELSIFTNYDIWPNYLKELSKLPGRCYLISAKFRPSQIYFQWYGGFMRQALRCFNHIFTQNKDAKDLLSTIGLDEVSIAGDTRCDRVMAQLEMDNAVDFINTFKGESFLIVLGSTWPADDLLCLPYINREASENTKFLIAPHEISKEYSNQLKQSLQKKVVVYSDVMENSQENSLRDAEVFILDTIGYLSKAYAYADIAYVGGAAGSNKKGLHNILEPAVFKIPVCIGSNYKNFPEAVDLVNLGGVVPIYNPEEFASKITSIYSNKSERDKMGLINLTYIEERSGAVDTIIKKIV